MVDDRKKIEERLRRKQAELAGLEEKVRTGKVYVSALQDVLKMLGRTADDGEDVESKLRPGSAMAQARDAILAKGRPVHLDELLALTGKEVTPASKASMVGSLAAYVRRNEIFCRPAPNTFGLVELSHSEQPDDDQDADEPPAGFGRAPVTAASFDTDLDDDVPF